MNNCQKCIRSPHIQFWASEFTLGRTRLEDDPREGRPKIATTPEIIKQIHNIVNEDPSLTKREIANAISAKKVMTFVFLGSNGISLIDYLQKG